MKRWIVICLAASIVLAGGVAFFAYQLHRLPNKPNEGGVVATERLLKTAEQLRDSFTLASLDTPAETTVDYLSYLGSLRASCKALERYYEAVSGQEGALTTYLKQSADLCADLKDFVDKSGKLYQTAQPILVIDTGLKRYKTLPIAEEAIRTADIRAINTASSDLIGYAEASGVKSQVVQFAKQLRANAKNSAGLAYYQSVDGFKYSLLAERERYWRIDGDINALVATLRLQLKSLCQTAPSTEQFITLCSAY